LRELEEISEIATVDFASIRNYDRNARTAYLELMRSQMVWEHHLTLEPDSDENAELQIVVPSSAPSLAAPNGSERHTRQFEPPVLTVIEIPVFLGLIAGIKRLSRYSRRMRWACLLQVNPLTTAMRSRSSRAEMSALSHDGSGERWSARWTR